MRWSAWLAVLVASTAAGLIPSVARADFGLVPGSVTIDAVGPANQPYIRAGGHPDRVDISFDLNTVEEKADGNLKEFSIDLPPGFVGDGSAVPACPRSVFDGVIEEGCPPQSQVGAVTLKLPGGGEQHLSIFEVETPPGGVTELGAALILKFPMLMHLRPGDDGITITMSDVSQSIPVVGAELELWGVPADHQSGTGLSRRPFLTMPTSCDAQGLSMTVRARSWQQPDLWQEAHTATGVPLEGCGTLPFDPEVGLRLTNPQADTPTGADIDLNMPQSDDPDARASSLVKDVSLSLPEGMSVSPGAAQLLSACSDDEFGLGAEVPAACPPGSRVGRVEIVSPLLQSPVTGSVYLGEERPGERFRVLLEVQIAEVDVKLVGLLHADPESGQLTLALNDIPGIPFSRMTIHLEGGARALLVTPVSCGTATATATLSSYNASVIDASAETAIGSSGGGPCEGTPPINATFSGGAQSPRAGRATALSMTLRRRDGEETVERFSAALPLGMVARLGTLETCGTAAAATASCPDVSRIGSTVAEIGSGPQPAVLKGGIYLTGPYKRAPYGLALAYNASLGPFQLGTYVIRGSIRMDPRNGRVTIETDPLPRTIAGISARFQTIGLDIDRPGFVSNPTSCRPLSFEASVRAVDGRDSAAKAPFVLQDCESQRFRPDLSLGIVGDRLGKGEQVGFRIGLRMPPGDTNLRSMRIPLPEQLKFDSGNLREICARGDALDGECPAGSRVGVASAWTPLLSERLSGNVYVAQPPGNGLPDLWTVLEGQGLQLAIRAKTSSKNDRVFADLLEIPDVPISNLRMNLAAGDSSVLSLRRSLCPGARSRRTASMVALEGQDNAYRIVRVPVTHRSCRAAKQARREAAKRRRADG